MSTSVQEQIAEELDKQLLDILKTGQVVIDEKGQPVKVSPSAAMIQAINTRLKFLNVQSPITPGSAAGSLAEEADRRGLKYTGKLPGVSEDDDAATEE